MKDSVINRLVTLKGECFDAEFEGKQTGANRDGVFHFFTLTDLAKARGVIHVPIWRFGPSVLYLETVAEYDRREESVLLNVIRRVVDNGDVSFDVPAQTELSLQSSDFQKQALKSDLEIRAYIIHKAYWLCYRYPEQNPQDNVLYPIPFDEALDLEYLGANIADVRRNIARLGNQGLLEKISEGYARPSEKLLQHYEAGDWAVLGLSSVTSLQPVGKSDDRMFARLAIDQARRSVSEADGKPHPKVGAIVVKDGRVLSTAHRGELPANHAEYIALEKKLSDEAVAGATVYTTLEPCTTRSHPKLPCVKRLIERKVARVVIGMLDPDPRITGRGQRSLRSASIITDFFPPDLMSEVEELNRDFTRYCEQQGQALPTVSHDAGKLEIAFVAGRKPYFEEMPKTVMPGGVLLDRRYRVGLWNKGGAIISRARVVLESCEPSEHHGIHLCHSLQLMDAPPGTGEFPIQPGDGPSAFVDVVYDETLGGNLRGDAFGLCYASPVASYTIPRGSYVLTLRVDGDGLQSRKKFRISQDSTSKMLTMCELST
jgi:pyrimidine deaminase RibD-like protein